ncbi:Uncharacterised protein [Pseudomonas putida]|nr:hypothetical protein [Pseudomonas sp. KHPS1]CAB5601498.1 Uncharacterised protein [Pseudomonas putida]UTH37259.1 hypothetical protein NLY39_03600 [Pseudomonas sp. KHPS1]CAB5676329.1 Uncharacterised protein [Pseudomonas putida]CAB5698995.1 Uncharacterised protein [Pseudomonas putida]CAC9681437.1 Uncharacterised protein [Pseudomonas putida]
MEESLPTSLCDFVSDPDSAWVEQQLLAHIRGLERQGLKPRTIARALARALFNFCLDLYDNSILSRLWVRDFLQATGRDFIQDEEMLDDIEKLVVLREKYLKKADPLGSA